MFVHQLLRLSFFIQATFSSLLAHPLLFLSLSLSSLLCRTYGLLDDGNCEWKGVVGDAVKVGRTSFHLVSINTQIHPPCCYSPFASSLSSDASTLLPAS